MPRPLPGRNRSIRFAGWQKLQYLTINAGVPVQKRVTVLKQLGYSEPAADRSLILLKGLVKSAYTGAAGWYAAFNFHKQLPENVSFQSEDVNVAHLSVDRHFVVFEAKKGRLEAVNGTTKNVQIFKVQVSGISKSSHVSEPGLIDTFFIPHEHIPTGQWTHGANMECQDWLYHFKKFFISNFIFENGKS